MLLSIVTLIFTNIFDFKTELRLFILIFKKKYIKKHSELIITRSLITVNYQIGKYNLIRLDIVINKL